MFGSLAAKHSLTAGKGGQTAEIRPFKRAFLIFRAYLGFDRRA